MEVSERASTKPSRGVEVTLVREFLEWVVVGGVAALLVGVIAELVINLWLRR